MKHSLSRSEWSFLAIFFLIMATLVLIAKVNITRAADTLRRIGAEKAEIFVTIEGAVKRPGTYTVKEGASVKSILQKAGPKHTADLRNIPIKELVINSTHWVIPELKEIHVFIDGAVLSPSEEIMPVGSRICDLKSKVICTADADKSFFKRKRRLKNGEKIEVPKKALELN
jgi:DNA uptake protein ComE-like DNA-binding protein